MHQPSRTALKLADGLLDTYGGVIQEVAVSAEIPTTYWQAELIRDHLATRLRRRWGRAPWVFTVDDETGTAYTSAKRWNVDRYRIYAAESKLQPETVAVRFERSLCVSVRCPAPPRA
jgi:hypothetical protein